MWDHRNQKLHEKGKNKEIKGLKELELGPDSLMMREEALLFDLPIENLTMMHKKIMLPLLDRVKIVCSFSKTRRLDGFEGERNLMRNWLRKTNTDLRKRHRLN